MKSNPTKSSNKRSSTKHSQTLTPPGRSFSWHDHGSNNYHKNKQQQMEIGEDSHRPVTVTSPSNFIMKSEYLILDITTELVCVRHLHLSISFSVCIFLYSKYSFRLFYIYVFTYDVL